MNKLFSKIQIKHFKSIENISFQPKRINLIIGKPNSGKSNILEALSLYSPVYTEHSMVDGSMGIRFFNDVIRYKEMNQLFYDMDTDKPVEVISDKCTARLRYLRSWDQYDFLLTEFKKELEATSEKEVNNIGNFHNILHSVERENPEPKFIATNYGTIQLNGTYHTSLNSNKPAPVKKYFFHGKETFTNRFSDFLVPSGDNLYQIIQSHPKLRNIIDSILEESHLEFVFINKTKTFELQKRVNRIAYQTPWLLAADTLQRLIYHLAAVISNKDSVLLFEEPEAHSFPPYIDMLTEQIIDSSSNQFFITTHSPYIVNKFLDNKEIRKDLKIFIAHYKDYKTHLKQLTPEEMKQIHGYGIDIFYNLDEFVK